MKHQACIIQRTDQKVSAVQRLLTSTAAFHLSSQSIPIRKSLDLQDGLQNGGNFNHRNHVLAKSTASIAARKVRRS